MVAHHNRRAAAAASRRKSSPAQAPPAWLRRMTEQSRDAEPAALTPGADGPCPKTRLRSYLAAPTSPGGFLPRRTIDNFGLSVSHPARTHGAHLARPFRRRIAMRPLTRCWSRLGLGIVSRGGGVRHSGRRAGHGRHQNLCPLLPPVRRRNPRSVRGDGIRVRHPSDTALNQSERRHILDDAHIPRSAACPSRCPRPSPKTIGVTVPR